MHFEKYLVVILKLLYILRTLMPDRVWKIYKRYSYYSEFFDMVWLRHLLWPTIKSKGRIKKKWKYVFTILWKIIKIIFLATNLRLWWKIVSFSRIFIFRNINIIIITENNLPPTLMNGQWTKHIVILIPLPPPEFYLRQLQLYEDPGAWPRSALA